MTGVPMTVTGAPMTGQSAPRPPAGLGRPRTVLTSQARGAQPDRARTESSGQRRPGRKRGGR